MVGNPPVGLGEPGGEPIPQQPGIEKGSPGAGHGIQSPVTGAGIAGSAGNEGRDVVTRFTGKPLGSVQGGLPIIFCAAVRAVAAAVEAV